MRSPRRCSPGAGASVDYLVGTMIELPRAALLAGEIAASAEFFSFGTNDLTQTTMGLSRDDAGKFLGTYVERGVLERDPFVSIDAEGVGELVSAGLRARPQGAPRAQARRLRRARRRPGLDRLLRARGPGLRLLLAVPGADRPAGRGPGGAGARAEQGDVNASVNSQLVRRRGVAATFAWWANRHDPRKALRRKGCSRIHGVRPDVRQVPQRSAKVSGERASMNKKSIAASATGCIPAELSGRLFAGRNNFGDCRSAGRLLSQNWTQLSRA